MAHDPLLAQRVRRIVMRHAGSAEIHMFGGVCFTVHGNMCCGVANDDLMLRLGDAASSALDEPGVRPMDFTGRPSRTMVYVAAAVLGNDVDLCGWVARAVAHARSLPRKAGRAAKKK
ncbi:MAG: TfoX/Sxy family protein [Planctomycetes bacterium]|nr:TfoX/Sxy family protein [Planctomycetota bacterium]MCB9871526.1 TfoX/Sxy family protein [Planctomycetota bacterium]MCB9889425.1 TfoX/Sxy family protein [Planctomycetota bacterium]